MGLFDKVLGRRGYQRVVKPKVVPADPMGGTLDSSGAAWTVPVLELAYFPVDGLRVDQRITGDVGGSLDQVQRHVAATSQRVVNALEAGSATHHYRNPASQPQVRYEIVERIDFLEPLPTWSKPGHAVPMTDYNAICSRVDLQRWVDNGIRQVWIWGYHGGVIDLWESNMAGPHGDISNSDRDLSDLPPLDRTCTVYHYNYGRGASEAVEDHMHQIEALLRHLDPELFWDRFVGRTGEGRCGWAHYPPNAVRDYDWANMSTVSTDIEHWSPDGGQQQTLDARRWSADSLTWFVYWMQNLPGADNGLAWKGRPLSNWWHLIADLDDALARGVSLTR